MVTLSELRERHKKLIEDNGNKGGKGEGGNDFASLNKGDNWVRILPGKEEALDFYAESHVHKYVDEEGKRRTYQCRKSHGESCPMCDFYFELWNRHKELKLPKGEKSKYGNLATAIKLKERFHIKAVIRDLQAKNEPAVKFITASKQLFDRIMGALTNPDLCEEDDPDNTTIVSLDRGNDFNIKITEKGGFNDFGESEPRIKKTKAGTPKEIAEWMESPLNIKSLVKLEDYEEGRKIVQYLETTLNTVKTENKSTASNTSEDDNSDKFKQGLQA